ncbi:MAG: hypothetical protein PHX61_12795 [Alphaproteobacteria bacterium]|nr:hypothetical protein [Alphaproteobacteria bacterium]
MGIQSQVVMVTPQMAQKWLANGGKNRRISVPHVKDIANAMKAGKWVLNGETICFDTNGKLINGQHRLSAVVMSGMTVPILIVRGVDDPKAFETYDTNTKRRGVSDIIGMEGIKNASHVSAVARRLVAWEKCTVKNTFALTNEGYARIAGYEVLDYIKNNNHKIQPIITEIFGSLPFKRCGAGSALIASLVICNDTDEVATMLFIEGLKTGANLPANSPIHLLRERLIAPPERRGLSWETEVMALTIKSWNKYLHGKSAKTLRWTTDRVDGEKFPVPGERK